MAEDEKPDSSPEQDGVEASASSAGTEKTEERRKNYVPQERLNEVAAQRKAAEARVAELEQRLQAIEAAQSASEDEDGMDESVKQAKKLIEKYAAPVAKREQAAILQSLEGLKKELGELAHFRAQMQWEKLATTAGLDPTDKVHQGIVRGLVESAGMSVSDAVKKAAEMTARKPSGSVASAETDGLTGFGTDSDWIPKDWKDAVKGAKQGKRAKLLSSSEIIANRLAGEKRN